MQPQYVANERDFWTWSKILHTFASFHDTTSCARSAQIQIYSHVTHIRKTSRQVIGALRRNRKCLSLSAVEANGLHVHAMVESRIRYGCSAFFSSLSKANEERLQRLCNLRAVYNLTSRTRMTPVYAEHNLLRVHQLLRETVCSLVYWCLEQSST